jgi:hypothetical protein
MMSANALKAATVLDVSRLEGWLPVDADVRDGRPGVLWVDMRGVSFDEPFFADTVARRTAESLPGSGLFTELDTLLQFEKTYPGRRPTGLIFHASRCGSTAVANALKSLHNTVVLSEPYIVDKLIGRLFTDVDNNRTKELLYSVFIRAAVGILGQHDGHQGNFAVKFSATSGLQISRLLKIWQNVPWAFIYRDPLEIAVSNLRDPPIWLDHLGDTRMAAALIETDESEVRRLSTEEFCARVIGRLFQTVSENLSRYGRLLNYRDLSPQSVVELANFFSINTENVEQVIETSLRFYSKEKRTQRLFAEDSNEKRSAASAELRNAVNKWTVEPYERLERLQINASTERGNLE